MARNLDIFDKNPSTLQCKAHKKDGVRCLNYAAPGHTVCWKHGVGGKDSLNRRKYKFKSENLNTAFNELASDPDRLDLTEEIALSRTCLQQVLQDVEHLDSKNSPAVLMLVESVTTIATAMAKIEKDLKLSVNPEQLTLIADQFITIIAKHVTNEDVLAAIQDDLDRIALPEANERVVEHET